MKRRFFLIVLFAAIVSLAAVACNGNVENPNGNEPGFALDENASIIWLDRYSETTVPLAYGDAAALTWTSADESIVTVTAGYLIAQGEGETVVTVTDGVTSQAISVRVNDSGTLPAISVEDFDAYVDVDAPIPAVIRYNGDVMNSDGVIFTAEIADTDIATSTDGHIRGVTTGQTNAVIRATYKGLALERNCVITVRESTFIDFGDPIELYAAVGNESLNSTVLAPEVIVLGQTVENASVTYSIASGDEFVELDAETGTVKALAEGEAVIEGSYSDGSRTVTGEVAVTVHPNWVAGAFINSAMHDITWQPATGTIGGRSAANTDMMEYRAPEDFDASIVWEYRVTGSDTGTLLTDLYRRGYRYFAYDVYYTSNQNFYMGTGRDPQWVQVGEFFRRDYMKIYCDTDGDGVQEVTNRVDKNIWMTFAFDLLALIESNPSWTSEFFLTGNDGVSSTYVMNVRYYLDDTFIQDDENLIYTDMGTYTQATEDEFDVAFPVSSGYANLDTTGQYGNEIKEGERAEYGPYDGEVGGRTGVYRYVPHTTSSWKNNLVVASSMNKSYDLGLTKLYSRGHYLTFDVYIEQATTVFTSLNHTTTSASITLGKTDLSAYSDWLNVIKDGKRQYTIEEGNWYTFSLGFRDAYTPGTWRSTIYFSTNGNGDILYIDNVRYEKTGDFLPTEYEGMAPPKGVETPHPDTSVETESEGEYIGKIKYTSYIDGTSWDNHAASVRFTDVTTNNTAAGTGTGVASYFAAGYKYIKLDFLLADNATGFGFHSWATYQGQYGVQQEGAMDIGGTNNGIFLFDAETQERATTLESNKWYTLFIPTEYTGTETPDWAMIEFRSRGGSAEAPAVVYLDNIEYTYEITYAMPEVDWTPAGMEDAGKAWTLTDVTEGEFAGWKRFDTGRDNWNECLVIINSADRTVYDYGARYVTMTVNFENLRGLGYYDNMFTQSVVHREVWNMGEAFEGSEWLRFRDAEGNAVTTLQNGETYTMCIKIGQTRYVGWGELRFIIYPTAEALEAGNRGAVYFTDLTLHYNDPFAA